MDELLGFVKLIASRLDSARIPYMVTGSMAMAVYAMPRMTRDIDLVVEVGPSDVERIVALFSEDCYVDGDSVRQAVRERGMFNIIHNDWVIKADFIVRKDEEYRRQEFARRQRITIEDATVSIVAAEDLVLSKLAWVKGARSGLQLQDAHQIMSAVPQLDWEYMHKWAAILGVGDLLREAKGHE